MGQSNSRYRDAASPPQAVAPQSDAIVHDEPSNGDAQPSIDMATTSRTKRNSRRQSLKTLIGTNSWSRMRNRLDNSLSRTDSQSSRKRWRMLKRWSKAPAEIDEHPREPILPVSENSSGGLETPVASSSTNSGEREELLVDRAQPIPAPLNPDAEVATPDPIENERATSSNIGTWMGGHGSLAQSLGLPILEDDEVVISPEAFREEQDGNADANVRAETTDGIQMPAQPVQDSQVPIPMPLPLPPVPTSEPRFPPPGTLVVVQGVVHTTDVSRPSAPASATTTPSAIPSTLSGNPRRASSYTPRSSTPVRSEAGYPRSRRSSAIPPPSSSRTRPFSMVEPSVLASSSASTPESEPTLIGEDDATLASNGPETDTRTPASSGPGSTPILSSNSIDVLGTLLSVAAAATAASLLTGSSDPIFASALAPSPSIPSATTTHATNIYERPTSPTPTAGLGNLSSLPAGLGLGAAAPQSLGSGRRMRHAWGSLRERLGRRNANGGESQTPRTRPDGTPMDAREIMLAEMARAFNLGLGLGNAGPAPDSGGIEVNIGQQQNGDPPSAPYPDPAGVQQPPEVPLPAEGSFERFLVDLQADLRVALSTQDPPPNQLPYAQRPGHESRIAQPTAISSTGPPTSVDENVNLPTGEATGLADIHLLPATSTNPSPTDQDGQVEVVPDLPALSPSFRSTSSPLQEQEVEADQTFPETGPQRPLFRPTTRSDSESDTTDGDLDGMSEAPRVTRPSGVGAAVESGPLASRTERRPGGGINWWRSYRFPAITTPHGHGVPNTLNNPNLATSPLATAHPTGAPSETSTTASPSARLSTSASSPQDPEPGVSPAAENRSNVVIPVIVVGLQSVNMDRGRDQRPGDNDGTIGANNNEPESPGMGGDLNFDGMLGDGDLGPQAHGRTWHSRAANAFRNLRPGRRASRAAQLNDGVGSRTFLIYVIGGYYPPDHSLITGANALDSFEALWELAELIGQAKPQTVSREEIDNSGLEIIKSTVLPQYEKEGRVASNCLERCLICLDDYVPEADLRLLACKHAFHKSCVDQWLQVGKNNCPACRTKGVLTGPDATPGSPLTSPT